MTNFFYFPNELESRLPNAIREDCAARATGVTGGALAFIRQTSTPFWSGRSTYARSAPSVMLRSSGGWHRQAGFQTFRLTLGFCTPLLEVVKCSQTYITMSSSTLIHDLSKLDILQTRHNNMTFSSRRHVHVHTCNTDWSPHSKHSAKCPCVLGKQLEQYLDFIPVMSAYPVVAMAFTSAPLFTNSLTMFASPLRTASCRGVVPSAFVAFTSGLYSEV